LGQIKHNICTNAVNGFYSRTEHCQMNHISMTRGQRVSIQWTLFSLARTGKQTIYTQIGFKWKIYRFA